MPLSIRIALRTFFSALILVMRATVVQAQDPAADAAQQASQQAMQATQQAMEASQQAIQQAQQANAQAQQDVQIATQNMDSSTWIPYVALKPKFSVKPGTYSQAMTVKMTDATRGAIIYYTTDGWTPTVNSNRYGAGGGQFDDDAASHRDCAVPGTEPGSQRAVRDQFPVQCGNLRFRDDAASDLGWHGARARSSERTVSRNARGTCVCRGSKFQDRVGGRQDSGDTGVRPDGRIDRGGQSRHAGNGDNYPGG